MSLDYTLSNIENWSEVCLDDDGSLRPVTEVLIFTTMSVGIGEITEANVTEWIARLAITEAIDGGSIIAPDGQRSITEDEVIAHIGLSTNVFPALTRAQWLKQQIGRRVDERKNTAARYVNRKRSVA